MEHIMKFAINLITYIVITGLAVIMLYQHIDGKYQPLYANLKNSDFSRIQLL